MKINQRSLKSCNKSYKKKRENSLERGIEFSLPLDVFANLRNQTHCAYTGVKFDDENVLSIERIDNDLGYVPGNCIAVTSRANGTRSDSDVKDLGCRIAKAQLDTLIVVKKPAQYSEARFQLLCKPVISAKAQHKYAELSRLTKVAIDKIERLQSELDNPKTSKDKQVILRKKISNVKTAIGTYKGAQNKIASSLTIYGKRPHSHAFYNKCRRYKRRTDSESIIELLTNIKKGLTRHTNLSKMDHMKLVAGLPLTASLKEVFTFYMGRVKDKLKVYTLTTLSKLK